MASATSQHLDTMMMTFPVKLIIRYLVLLVMGLAGIGVAGAGTFSLNFNPQLDPANLACGIFTADCTLPGGFNPNGGYLGGNDGSRFIQEKIYINGVNYFHVVVGSEASGFALESYVTATNDPTILNTLNFADTPIRNFSPDGGGNERSVMGDRATFPLDTQTALNNLPGQLFGNAKDPTGALSYTDTQGNAAAAYRITGNGTMDPSRVVLRMVLSDAQMSQEVSKPLLSRKPIISQTTVDSTMSGQFIADMRGLSYSDMNTVAPLINRLVINDPNLPVKGVGDFDMSMAQRSNITAGRYTYTPGQRWVDALTGTPLAQGWDADNSTFKVGTYTYTAGEFNVIGVDWSSFFDYSQNVDNCTNPNSNRRSGVCPQ